MLCQNAQKLEKLFSFFLSKQTNKLFTFTLFVFSYFLFYLFVYFIFLQAWFTPLLMLLCRDAHFILFYLPPPPLSFAFLIILLIFVAALGWAIILFYFILFYMYLLFLLWQYLLLSLKTIILLLFITFGKYLSQHYLTQRRTGGQASMLLNVTRALSSLLHCSRWPSQQPLNMDCSPSRTFMNFRQCVNH